MKYQRPTETETSSSAETVVKYGKVVTHGFVTRLHGVWAGQNASEYTPVEQTRFGSVHDRCEDVTQGLYHAFKDLKVLVSSMR